MPGMLAEGAGGGQGLYDAATGAWRAEALPCRSYRPLTEVSAPTCWTAAMTEVVPARPSRPKPLLPEPSVRTQRICPSATAWASQEIVGEDSLPEKPPRPATSAPLSMMASAEPCWEETPMVPPPWASAYWRASVRL